MVRELRKWSDCVSLSRVLCVGLTPPPSGFMIGTGTVCVHNRTRRGLLTAALSGAVGLAGCLGSGRDETDRGETATGDVAVTAWQTTTLTDVTTGETFTVESIDAPVFLHPFAVWCSTCKRQNDRIDTFQRTTARETHVIQLNIGDDEGTDDVRQYAAENGYDEHSRFAVAPPAVASSLVEAFGPAAVSPPQSPVILTCADGTVSPIEKVADTEALADAVDLHCQ